MRVEQEVRHKYITDDGEIFYVEEEAIEHEEQMIRERLYENTIVVNRYHVMLIENEKELDALKHDDYGERQFIGFESIQYPFYITEVSDSDCYYFTYRPLDKIIENEKEILKDLIAINNGDYEESNK